MPALISSPGMCTVHPRGFSQYPHGNTISGADAGVSHLFQRRRIPLRSPINVPRERSTDRHRRRNESSASLNIQSFWMNLRLRYRLTVDTKVLDEINHELGQAGRNRTRHWRCPHMAVLMHRAGTCSTPRCGRKLGVGFFTDGSGSACLGRRANTVFLYKWEQTVNSFAPPRPSSSGQSRHHS